MKRLLGALSAGTVLFVASNVMAAPATPPGGSAWVRGPINAAGQPHGYVEFQKYCSSCHTEGPEKRPGTEALRAKYNGEKPALLSDRTDLTPDVVKYMVRNGVSVMPTFRKTEISDRDLDAIAAYLSRNYKQ